jgi:hypothetical protein
MWPFTKKIKPGVLKLIVDFRSSSIGGALVVHEENKDPIIIYSTRNYIFLDKLDNTEIFFNKIISGLDKVLDSVEKEGIKKNAQKFSENFVSEVWCAFSSPWYKSKIKNFEINNGKSTKFTDSVLNKVLKNESETDKKTTDETSIEKKIVSVCMNGYEVAEPFGKEANQILVSFYSSVIATKTIDVIKKRISDKFSTNNIKICTHPMTIISVIRKFFHSVSDFVFVDIGGETTDIGLFRGGKLEDLVTIPAGTHHFLRKLIEEYKLDLTTAMSHLSLLFSNKLDEATAKKSLEIVNKVKGDFVSIINSALLNKWTKEITPVTIFLTSDLESGGLVKDLILSKDFYAKCLKINREPILQIINKSSMPNLCKEDINIRPDPLLSLITTFSNI